MLVSVGNTKTPGLIDTGASISCISLKLLEKSGLKQSNIRQSECTQVRGVGGETHKVLGVIDVKFRLGHLSFEFPFHVLTHLHHSFILGLDFLEENNVSIHPGSRTISIQEGLVVVAMIQCDTGLARAKTSCTIPPKHECDLEVKVTRTKHGETVLLEPVSQLSNLNVCGGKTLTKVLKGKATIRLLNPTTKEVFIPANRVLASVSPVDINTIHVIQDDCDTSDNLTSVQAPVSSDPISFDLSESDLTNEQKSSLNSFLAQNRDVFAKTTKELGKTTLYHHRIETGDATPIRLPHYRQNPNIRAECAKQVKQMLEDNIIQKSRSQWRSPVVMVKKKCGDYRFAVDYRKLNAVSQPMFFPMIRMEDVIDSIGESQAQLFSVLDCASGFWQIPMDPETKDKSAFITPEGVFEWNRMPFGLKNAPMTFQMLMSEVLRDMNWKYVLVYVDDIIIFSKTFEEHLNHLHQVFSKLREAGLTLKPSKCRFAARKVVYLGHIFSKNGIEVDPSKTAAVKTIPAPKNQHTVRQFLGLANYYRKFVNGFSKIAAPLNNLLKNETKFVWDQACQSAFDELKTALTSAPILIYPNMDKPFILTTDASGTALGYILSQLGEDGKEHVIHYGGRSLKEFEKKWSVSEQEMLGVLEGIKFFRVYLAHQKFTIITDHKALTSLKSMKHTGGRLSRWAIQLQEYSFDIVHRPGKQNTNADALSRREYPETNMQNDTEDGDPLPFPTMAPVYTEDAHPRMHLSTTFQYAGETEATQVVAAMDPVDPKDKLPEVAQYQRQCPDLKDIIYFLETNQITDGLTEKEARSVHVRSEAYDLKDGVLYHFQNLRDKSLPADERRVTQVALPKIFRPDALKTYHDSIAGGCHKGRDATRQALIQKYHWPGLYQDVEDYIKSCEACQKAKRAPHAKRPPLTSMPIEETFSRLHIDFIGPLTQTQEGYKHILLVVDSFSGWCEAFPTKTQDAKEIAGKLYNEIFTRYGAPRTIVSDRGANFMSKLVEAVCELFQVTRHCTSSYHPQTNSSCERRNSVIEQALRTYCDDKHSNWPDIIPSIMMSLRSTPSQTTNCSPYSLLFGKEMLLPFDTSMVPKETLGKDAEQHLKSLIDHLKTARKIAAENTKVTQERNKHYYDQKSKEPTFQLQDQVMMQNNKRIPGLSSKLQPKHTGPYYIKEIGPNYTYKLRDCQTDKPVKAMVNASRLVRYHDPNVVKPHLRHQQQQHLQHQPMAHQNIRGVPEKLAEKQKTAANSKNTQATNASKPNAKQCQNKPSKHSQSLEKDKDKSASDYYEIQKILQCKWVDGTKMYKIKWKLDGSSSWEPEYHINREAKNHFHESTTYKGKSKKKRKTLFR